ncbi:hypothetical protein Tco_1524133 [Tanacetum coccineum]
MKLCEGTLEGVGGKQRGALEQGVDKQALQEAIISSVKITQFLYLRKHTPIKKVVGTEATSEMATHITRDGNSYHFRVGKYQTTPPGMPIDLFQSLGGRVQGSRVAYRMLPD